MRCRQRVLGLVLMGGTCLGQDLAELEIDHNVQTAFATPHTDWAVPSALALFAAQHGRHARRALRT